MIIAQVSKKFNIPTDTLRYYEKIGLIPTVNRKENGIRDYAEEDLRWVEFIKCMRSAGLPIEVLTRYVDLFKQGEKTSVERMEILVEQKRRLTTKINEMENTLSMLNKKIKYYKNTSSKKNKANK